MLPVLPQEILGEILEKLHQDPRTLQSCSLVSSSLRKPSQQLLFNRIMLILRYTAGHQRLHDVLSKNPTLTSYVHSIHVTVDETLGPPVEAMCRILDITKAHVRELSIRSITYIVLGVWSYIHPKLQDSILGVISSPSCISLNLGSVGFPIQHLRVCPHIRHLKFACHNSVVMGDVSDASASYDQPKQLGYLESLTAESIPLEHLVECLEDTDRASSLSLSRLRSFAAIITKRSAVAFQKIFHLSEEYLEEVAVIVDLGLSRGPVNFSRLSHLRILRIEIRVIQSSHCIAILLATIPLHTVELHLLMEWQIAISVGKKGWPDIEAVLLDKWHEGVLRSVVIDLKGWQGSRRFLNERMPRLVERGIAITW
ncbi:hypothetical protein FPV67DRAFT_1514159 [Lyophyllum atratum]|nr:hypothetical protein FPV67DRAFT_1514159 [Lyophyllum atratum]